MLVLSRKMGETIEIGGEITIEVLQIKGNRVQIGIRAPKDIRILRGELPSKHEFEGGVLEAFASYPLSHQNGILVGELVT